MKKRVFLGLLALLAFFAIAILSYSGSSSNHCTDNQIILRLSSSGNAHGAIAGNADYNTKVCYDDIFGGQYGNANSPSLRNCKADGSNSIVKLSSSGNAHGEQSSGSNYNVQVCYGDLDCRIVDSSKESCNTGAGEREVIGLSSLTNAHLELGSESNYNYIVCCSAPGVGPTECEDGIDNDGDGEIDVDDAGCGDDPSNDNEEPQCEDGIDNDGDGEIDVDDAGCGGDPSDDDERPECDDGKDNDKDGDVDLDDSDCSDNNDNNEGPGAGPGPGPDEDGRAYWADASERELADRAEVGIGETVSLIALQVPTNGDVVFEILEDDLLVDDKIKTSPTVKAVGRKAKYNWEITAKDYEDNKEIDGKLELYFIAKSSNNYNEESNILILDSKKFVPEEDFGCKVYNDQSYVAKLEGNPTKEEACNEDPKEQFKKDPLYVLADKTLNQDLGIGCNKEIIDGDELIRTTCECKWKEKDNKCEFSSGSQKIPLEDGGGVDDNVCAPKCDYDYNVGICEDELQTITKIGTIIETELCTEQDIDDAKADCIAKSSIEVVCGEGKLTVPFFSWGQFLISGLAIFVIYGFILLNRRIRSG